MIWIIYLIAFCIIWVLDDVVNHDYYNKKSIYEPKFDDGCTNSDEMFWAPKETYERW